MIEEHNIDEMSAAGKATFHPLPDFRALLKKRNSDNRKSIVANNK
ncbi:MAG TPA: hypothetical protein VKB19_01090 [Pedobacter sp.]|nr:hypothetical protein [Pedobacter sp.]